MNKKTLDNLWLVASKMHGIFETSELCKVMIYSLFLEYVKIKKNETDDDEYLSSYDDKFTLAYLALTYGKMVRAKELSTYVAKIEKELGLDETVIAVELERLLDKADSDNVRSIFGAIAEIAFDTQEHLYDVAIWLLDKLTLASGKAGVEYFTSRDICKLETRLLDCKEGMLVYDGFCGCGVSVNEVAGNKSTVYMQELVVSSLSLATIITLLKGSKVGAIRCGDSLLNPLSDMKYDRIVCEPPFMPRYSNEYMMSVPEDNYIYQDKLNSESLPLRHVLAHLKEDGIATVVVPMGMLFKSGRMGEIREMLAKNYIDAVIEFPQGVWLNTGVKTALLVLKKQKTDASIYMINAKDFFDKTPKKNLVLSDENADKIVALYKNRETVEGVSINASIAKIRELGFNLCTTQYVTSTPEDTIKIEDTSVYVQKYDQLVGQLAEIDKQLGAVRSRFTKGA